MSNDMFALLSLPASWGPVLFIVAAVMAWTSFNSGDVQGLLKLAAILTLPFVLAYALTRPRVPEHAKDDN